MRAKEFEIVEAKKVSKNTSYSKPRNPVAKNSNITTSGAGQHKDRKAATKRGEVKHKGQSLGESLTKGDIQKKIDYNKKMMSMARQKGWDTTSIENAIAKLQAELKSAPTERPAGKPRTPIPAGYKYDPYEETEFDGENSKIFHSIITPDGKRVDVDFTPYQEMTGRDIELWIKLGMPKSQGGRNFDSETLEKMAREKGVVEDQVDEVSKDFEERERAGREIAKIIDNSKGTQWDDYTPEQLKQIQQLAKTTGRRYSIWSKKLGGEMKIGRIIDLMSKYIGMKQRDSGEMPEFTGRAATAKDMANQIALQTNGDPTWRHGTTWTSSRGHRSRDPQDHVAYKDKQSYNDAWQWIESRGKKVHYKTHHGDTRTAIQIGSYIVEPSSRTRAPLSGNAVTEYSVSVRSTKAIGQPTRTKQDISDQEAAAIRDIANTRNANALEALQALVNILDGEEDVKKIIDQSKKINPRDKAKLDKIISDAGKFKESKSHVSPSGVKTNMSPSDDDYAINYGKNGNVAKFRKKQDLNIKTGSKKVDEVDMSSPEFQQLLKSVGEKAKQGPKKTVYDPRTGKYKVVPVKSKGE